jgi:hypothetical protein
LKARLLLVCLMPVLHLCACLAVAVIHLESAWKYLLVIDIPMSVVIVAISYNFDHPLLLFGTLGTLWWYLLSRAVDMIATRVETNRRSRLATEEPRKIAD